MIGEPTNFVHMAHIGSDDVGAPGHHLTQLQQQMRSKGSYADPEAPLKPSAPTSGLAPLQVA